MITKKACKTGRPFRENVSTEKHRILGSTQPTYEGSNSLYAQSFSFTITPFHQQGIKESQPPGFLIRNLLHWKSGFQLSKYLLDF